MRTKSERKRHGGGLDISRPPEGLERGRGSSWRRLLKLAGLSIVGAALGSASCGKTDNYEYIDVSVFVDTNTVSKMDFATKVVSCEMYVTGSETSSPTPISCAPTQQSYPSVGTFEWTTKLGKGSLQFTVTLFGLNRVPFAVGTSEAVTLGSAQKLTANVVTILVPDTTPGTGGTAGTGGVIGTGGAAGIGGNGGSGVVTGTGGAAGGQGSGGTSGNGGVSGTGGAGGSAGGSAGRGGATGSGGAGGFGGSLGGAGGGSGATSGAAGSAGGAGGS